jgi:RNA polymerase sigma-70 factor, ECF subfamily
VSKEPRHITTWTDEELVVAYRDRDDPGFVGELFRRYTDLVFFVSMKYLKDAAEAEDMTMKVFERLLIDLKKYEVRSFRYWLHTVVKNQCLAQLEQWKKQREKHSDFELDQKELVENGHEPSLLGELSEDEQLLRHLEKAMGLLQEHQRICVELFYLEKKSYQEVASLTGFDLKQVKSYIQNGKRNLKLHILSLADQTPPNA